jgi:nucleoside-triphosphatase THEP1
MTPGGRGPSRQHRNPCLLCLHTTVRRAAASTCRDPKEQPEPEGPRVLLLSGPAGCGKTTVCVKVIELARARGLAVAGLLTPPRQVEGRIVGLDVQNVWTGERRGLAEDGGPFDGPVLGRWHFHRDALAWGASVLGRIEACALLVIDEFGPLELSRGGGWVNGLALLRTRVYDLGLVVVRPSLVLQLRELLSGLEVQTLLVTESNRDQLPQDILSWIAET